MCFFAVSRLILFLILNVPDKVCRESKHTFYAQSYRLWDNVQKYCRAGQATHYITALSRCMLDTKVYKYALIICNTAVPLLERSHESASILHYMYIACLVLTYLQLFLSISFQLIRKQQNPCCKNYKRGYKSLVRNCKSAYFATYL
jgi:hypothetical protein